MRPIATCCLPIALAATLVAPADAESRWTRVGPDGGAGLEYVASAPSSPSTLYTGNHDSLFRSDDFGETWREVAPGRPVEIQRLTVHPDDAEILLAEDSRVGLRRSTDGGRTWTQVAAPQDVDRALFTERVAFGASAVAYAFQDDRDPGYVGILRSTDGGASWSGCGEVPDDFIERLSPVVDPRRPGRLYVAAGQGLWRSNDGCATWSLVPSDDGPAVFNALVVDVGGGLWAARNSASRVSYSADGGVTWSPRSPLSGLQVLQLVADPTTASRLHILVTSYLLTTEDGGATWTQTTPFDTDLNLPFYPFLHEMAIGHDPARSLWTTTHHGIERSTDAGRTWTVLRRGMGPAADIQRLRIHPDRPDDLWAAGFGGLARSRDGGRTWRWVDTGFDLPYISDVAIDPRDGALWAAASFEGILHSVDDGVTWQLIAFAGDFAVRPLRLAVDPHRRGRVVATGSPIALSRMNVLQDDQVVRAEIGSADPREVVFDPTIEGRVVYSTPRGIEVIDDIENSGSRVTFDRPTRGLLASTAADPRRLWTVDTNTARLWRSDDFGETWTEVVGDLPAQIGDGFQPSAILSLSAAPHDPDELVLGGVWPGSRTWRTVDGGVTWQSAEVPGDGFVDQVVYAPDDPRVAWYAVPGQGLLRREDRPLPACFEDQGRCLRSGRFEVIVDWRDASGNSGRATRVVDEVDTTGLFWFFDEENWELMVKVLDGCAINDRFWVLAAATTDVDLTMRVEDRWSGLSRTTINPLGRPAAAQIDSDAFATCGVAPPEGADTSPPTAAAGDLGTTLALADGRFRASVVWNTGGEAGEASVAPLRTGDSGLFWFFDPANWEMLVKVLDGCAINGHHWVLAGISSDVGYTLTIEDTETGTVRVYEHAPGTPAPARVEIEAFACE